MMERLYPCEIIREAVEYPYVINPPVEEQNMTIEGYYELLEEAYHNAGELLKLVDDDGVPVVERVWCGSKMLDADKNLVGMRLNLGGVYWTDKKHAPKREAGEERYLSPSQYRVNGRGKPRKGKNGD